MQRGKGGVIRSDWILNFWVQLEGRANRAYLGWDLWLWPEVDHPRFLAERLEYRSCHSWGWGGCKIKSEVDNRKFGLGDADGVLSMDGQKNVELTGMSSAVVQDDQISVQSKAAYCQHMNKSAEVFAQRQQAASFQHSPV